MGISLNQDPFLDPKHSTAPLIKDLISDLNLDNCRYTLALQASWKPKPEFFQLKHETCGHLGSVADLSGFANQPALLQGGLHISEVIKSVVIVGPRSFISSYHPLLSIL